MLDDVSRRSPNATRFSFAGPTRLHQHRQSLARSGAHRLFGLMSSFWRCAFLRSGICFLFCPRRTLCSRYPSPYGPGSSCVGRWWDKVLRISLGGSHLPLCTVYASLLIVASQRPFAALYRLTGIGGATRYRWQLSQANLTFVPNVLCRPTLHGFCQHTLRICFTEASGGGSEV